MKQLKRFVPKLIDGTLKSTPQISHSTNYWRKRSKKDGIIDWRMNSNTINLVRALTKPYPRASLFYKDKEYKVWQSEIELINFSNIEPGKILDIKKQYYLN